MKVCRKGNKRKTVHRILPGCFLALGIAFSAGCASKEEAGVRGITEEVSGTDALQDDTDSIQTIEETVSENAHGNLEMFRSEEELKIAQTGRLAGKLVEQGYISDAAELYPVAAYQRDIDYSYAYFHDYSHKAESEAGICYPYELYYMSMSDEGDIVYYYTVLDYYSETAEDTGAKVIYAGNERDEVIREVTDLAGALKIDEPYRFKRHYVSTKVYDVGIDWFLVFADQWPQEKTEQLEDPVTAVETLYNLQGGTGQYSRIDGLRYGAVYDKVSYLSEREEEIDALYGKVREIDALYGKVGTVTYRFANGEEVTYLMFRDGTYWHPFYCTEKDDELYPELKGITDYTKRVEQVYSVAKKNVTAEELKEACVWYDHDSALYYYNDTDGVFLRHMSNGDIGIYSCGGRDEKLILIGDDTYSAEVPVFSRYNEKELASADFDGDGQDEYAYRINTWGGTECYYEELYIFDPEGDQLNMRAFQEYEFSEEMLAEVLPENCYLWFMGKTRYELNDDQILGYFQVLYDKGDGSRPEAVGGLSGVIRYYADGSFGFEEAEFEMYEELQGTETEEELLGH